MGCPELQFAPAFHRRCFPCRRSPSSSPRCSDARVLGSAPMAVADKELSDLLELGDRIVGMATKGGATVAECLLRSGAELSARVRLGKPELVEEAAHRSAGLRVMKGKQVATTSTS